jgi:hypothetical protein
MAESPKFSPKKTSADVKNPQFLVLPVKKFPKIRSSAEKSKILNSALTRNVAKTLPVLSASKFSNGPLKSCISNKFKGHSSQKFSDPSNSCNSSPNLTTRKFPPRYKYLEEKSPAQQKTRSQWKVNKADLELIHQSDPRHLKALIDFTKLSITSQYSHFRSVLRPHTRKLSWKWETPKSVSSKTVRFQEEP